jgi:hypothetical protein
MISMTSTLAFARAPRIPPASASAFSRLSNITTAPVGAVDHLDQLLRGQDAVALGEELRDLVPVDAGLEVAPPSGPGSC